MQIYDVMKRALLGAAVLLLLAVPGTTQPSGGVRQSGAVVANDCVSWVGTNVIKDSGGTCGGGGGGSPGGSSTQVQYNNAGSFGGISGVTTNGTLLTIANGDLKLTGASSGTSTLVASATGGGTATLFTGSDTIVGLAATQTLTNKTISGSSNTLSNIANASLTNSTITIAGNSQALGTTLTAVTLTASLNLFSSTLQGLAPLSGGGTTNFLRADGTWATPPGGGGCTTSGSATQVLTDNGSAGCTSNAAFLYASGTATLGTAGSVVGKIALKNATSGTLTISPPTGALGTPTLTAPAVTDTLAVLGTAQTWTAVQTYTNSDIKLLGSSTGATTFTSANSGASNFTLTFPAVTDTLALAGVGAVISSNGTTTSPTAPQFNNNCPIYTVNATTATFNIPAASGLQVNGGCIFISNPSANSYTLSPNGTDLLNGSNSNIPEPAHSLILVTSDGAADYANVSTPLLSNTHIFVGNASSVPTDVAMSQDCTLTNTGVITCTKSNNVAFASAAFVATGTSGATIPLLNGTNVWSGLQSVAVTTLSVSTTTFTPTGATNNYALTLVTACSTACTIANPSATPVAGTSGVFVITQFSGGGKTLTWGTQYYAAGGSATVQPDTAANGINVVSYYVADATHIVIQASVVNATH